MDELGLRDRIAGTMRQVDLSLAEVWIEYFAIGGSLSELEIDAYLRGQAELPVLEGELLEPYIRFYAGYPLRGPGGWNVGTLCVMSTSPRTFVDSDLRDLESLAQEMQHEVYPGWKAWSLLP
ncbi:GAF domain-containing protein [Arthrobacter sp. B1805]|uniref:GAF domain-containing protein n=1 Tax=Arthrobacter sp. B1805 TaxID=2058892 RepID=UPI000CE3D83B|nr:GAF domain-containing protein [Arthrobacter sp. B1805]